MLRQFAGRGVRIPAAVAFSPVRCIRTSFPRLAADKSSPRQAARPGLPGKGSRSPSPARAAASSSQSAAGLFKYELAKQPATIYEHPELYELAFSFRDMKQEVKFLQDVFAKHVPGTALNSVLELGCGPAAHSIGLAAAGVPKVLGLDLAEEMLQYARWKVKSNPAAAALELMKGDMTDFDLKGRQFDMVVCLLGTFSHMLENSQAASCFRCISQHLKSGGIFVLELAHPGDLFDGTYIIGDGGKEVWEVPLGPAHKVLVEWGLELDDFDPVTQVLHRTVTLNLMKGDTVEDSLEEVIKQRQFTVQEILMLASLCGLELQELYGEMSLDVDLRHEEAYRMLAVLKKK